MDSDDFARQFFAELKTYAPVVLPTLFIYAIESGASLKLWHAVQQVPHVEKEVLPNDPESNVDATRQAEILATRTTVTKEARRMRIGHFSIGLILAAISVFEQYVTLKGMLHRSQDGDELENYAFEEFEESGFETENWYGWYYNSIFGQFNWADYYYAITLFWPAVILIARATYLLSGLSDRAVLRDTKGIPFMVFVMNDRFKPRRPALVAVTVVLASTLLSVGALWFRSSICATILFASLIHFMVSNITTSKAVTFKQHVISGFFLLSVLALLLFNVLSIGNPWPIRLFYFTRHVGDTNWSALIFTSLVCIGHFNLVSLCYRIDHTFARPEELLVGPPDIKIAIRNAAEVIGTRLSYAFSRFASSSSPRPRFAKPYFHTAVWSWLAVYALVAALSVTGYLNCEAESSGLFALYIASPLMCSLVLLRALLRGEVKKLWSYKEEWARNPADMQVAQGGLVLVESRDLETKSSVPEVSEKAVLEA